MWRSTITALRLAHCRAIAWVPPGCGSVDIVFPRAHALSKPRPLSGFHGVQQRWYGRSKARTPPTPRKPSAAKPSNKVPPAPSTPPPPPSSTPSVRETVKELIECAKQKNKGKLASLLERLAALIPQHKQQLSGADILSLVAISNNFRGKSAVVIRNHTADLVPRIVNAIEARNLDIVLNFMLSVKTSQPIVQSLEALAARVGPVVTSLPSPLLVHTVLALGRHRVRHPALLRAIASHLAPQLPSLSPTMVAAVFTSYAQLGLVDPELLVHGVPALEAGLFDVSMPDLVRMLSSLALISNSSLNQVFQLATKRFSNRQEFMALEPRIVQELAWAYSKSGCPCWPLFHAVASHFRKHAAQYAASQQVSMVWAFARAGYPPGSGAGAAAAAPGDSERFYPPGLEASQRIIEMVCANVCDDAVWWELAAADIPVLLWAASMTHVWHRDMFTKAFRALRKGMKRGMAAVTAAEEEELDPEVAWDKFTASELRQVYMAYVAYGVQGMGADISHVMAGDLGLLPAAVVHGLKKGFESEPKISKLHMSVLEALTALLEEALASRSGGHRSSLNTKDLASQYQVTLEGMTAMGWGVDILFPKALLRPLVEGSWTGKEPKAVQGMPAQWAVLEVNGPSHYEADNDTLTLPTRFKYSLLEHMGYTVGEVNWANFSRGPVAKRTAFLKSILSQMMTRVSQ